VINLHYGEQGEVNFRKFMAQYSPWLLQLKVSAGEMLAYQDNLDGIIF
jgi:hypothetical protein